MLKQQLQINAKQTVNLTSSLQQGINILQMSTLELQNFVTQELGTNPFLKINNLDENILPTHEALINDEYSLPRSRVDDYDPLASISYDKSLREYVLEQISLEDIQPSKLAYFLAEMLDDNGYLKIDLAEVCKKFAVSLEEINQILVSLQRLEPNGIFARNIAECLSIQLQSTCLLDHAFKIILENLDLVAQRNLPKLSKLCGITADDVKTRIQLLQRLNPKPGATFAPENVSYKIPDVIIYEKDMDLVVQLNKNPINDLYFDKSYYNQVSIASKDKDVSFLKSNYKAANYLIHNLKKRAKTLWQVANIIAEKQRNFLLKGVLFFNPMTLGEVAEIMQMNESTISRAVANKYVKVPWGVVYEMKFFFSSSVASKISDNKVSSTKVKELIKQIIEQEDDHAFSDEELVYELAKFNVKVARRTVSKYRELLDIPKSHFRKKLA